MSIWNAIRGHEQQQTMLRTAAKKSRLAHAFLFIGNEGIGKRRFAQLFAQTLLCERTEEADLDACGECDRCKQVQAGTHPDLLTVSLPEGKSEIPIDLILGKADQRGKAGLLHDLSLRPMAGERRIAILDHAEKLNVSSANALLKTLEEPPDDAIMILICSDLEAMLTTIRSRCQSLFFGALQAEDVRTILESIAADDDSLDINAISEFGLQSGSVSQAMIVWNESVHLLKKAVDRQSSHFPLDPSAVRAQLAAILEDIGGDTRKQRESAKLIIRFAVDFWNHQIKQMCGNTPQTGTGQSVLCRIPSEQNDQISVGTRLLERCLNAQSELSRNVSVPLCLDSMWNDLCRIQKRSLT